MRCPGYEAIPHPERIETAFFSPDRRFQDARRGWSLTKVRENEAKLRHPDPQCDR